MQGLILSGSYKKLKQQKQQRKAGKVLKSFSKFGEYPCFKFSPLQLVQFINQTIDPDVFSMQAIGAWYIEAEHQRLMDENPDVGMLGAIDAWGNANVVEPLRNLVGSNN